MFKSFKGVLFAFTALSGVTVLAAPAALAQTASESEKSAEGIGDIIVTANRRAESVQNVPLAITALDERALKEAGYGAIKDLTSRVPNLGISALWGTSNPKIFMRGIGNNNFNQTSESKVAVYLDQVYLSAPSGQLFQMFDLERVEVLRGPQGTLYGKNSTGGAISVVSKAPGDERDGYMRVSLGNYDAMTVEGAATQRFSDELAARVAFTTSQRDGYVTDLSTGRKVNDADQWAGRAVIAYEPTDTAKFLLNIHGGASHSTHNNSSHRGLCNPATILSGCTRLPASQVIAGLGVDVLGYKDPDSDPYRNEYGDDTFADIELFGTSLLSEFQLGDYTLTSVTGYENSKRHVLQDGNGAPSTLYSIDWGPSEFKQFSQELRLSSPDSGRLRWIVGGFYFKEEGDVHNFYNLADAAPILGFDAFDQFYSVSTEDWAFFAQGTFDITEKLRLTAGARYTTEERSIDHQTYLSTAGKVHLSPFTLAPAEIPFVNVDLKDEWKEPSWRVALDYKVTPDLMVFASVNRGFTAGGFNSGSFTRQDVAETPYDPEQLTSYELGFKSNFLEDRVRFNVTGFYYDYKDLQVFLFTATNDQYIANASNASVYGAEFEVQAKPTANWEINASLGLLQSEYKSFVQSGVDLSGNPLVGAPEVQGNIMSQYTVPLSFGSVTIRGDYTYTGERYYDERKLDDVSSQGSDINLDAQLIFRNADETFEASLWAKNLTDEVSIIDIVDVGAFGWQNVWYNMPRTYGVSFAYKF